MSDESQPVDGAAAARHDVDGAVPPSPSPAGVSSLPGLSPGYQEDGLVPAPDYFGPDVRIHENYQKHYDYIATVLGGSGVRPEIANAGMEILESAEDLELPAEQKALHRYDVSRFIFRAEDQPGLTYFLNGMAEKGAKQHEVSAFLTLYRDAERAREKRAAINAGKTDLQRKPGSYMSLEEIRAVMRTDRKRYNKDESMQRRYRDLLRNLNPTRS